MALRFRRSMKIAPGLTLNLGKKSASVRIGGRGAGFTTGTAGSRATVGVPGTGLSYTTKVATNAKSNSTDQKANDPAPPRRLGVFGWIGILFVIGGIIWLFTALF